MTSIQTNPDQDPVGVFFWARSGGGHRTAKEGVKQQKIKEYAAKGKTLDVRHDYDVTSEKVLNSVKIPFLGGLGDLGVNAWDEAQKKGDLQFLKMYASLGWIGEIIFYPLVYFKVKWMLQDLKVEPEFIVSTQAFCLKAMAHAIQTVNKEKNWNMHMNVYLTDLPSKKAIHFFPSIRRAAADKDLRKLITLHAPPPLLKVNQTSEDEKNFWKEHCGKVKVITDENFPIREAFLETGRLKARLEQPSVQVKIKTGNAQEADGIHAGLSDTALAATEFSEGHVSLNIQDKDKVAFLMLGSQPTTQSVLNWLQTFVQSSKETEVNDRQHYFFLYCGVSHTEQTRNPLLDAVSDEINRLKKEGLLAPHFSIVPFTNQQADEIALLMTRSDVSITRSGGATSMELLQLHQADLPKRADKLTLIHSEAALLHEEVSRIYDTSAFADKIKKEIAAQVSKRALLGSDEWTWIKGELETFCREQGYSEKKSQSIAGSILRLYSYAPEDAESPDLNKVLDSLKKHAKFSSKKHEMDEKTIEEKMKLMQQKAKYQELSLVVLRQLAIENILTKDGIVLWEAGNAKYLQKKIGAHVVNPQYAKELIDQSFFE